MSQARATPIHGLAHAALEFLLRSGAAAMTVALPSDVTAEISYRGPKMPDHLPDAIADYGMVVEQGAAWSGAHRLIVKVPLIVLDLAWNLDEPVRVMTFSRGDWEDEFLDALE